MAVTQFEEVINLIKGKYYNIYNNIFYCTLCKNITYNIQINEDGVSYSNNSEHRFNDNITLSHVIPVKTLMEDLYYCCNSLLDSLQVPKLNTLEQRISYYNLNNIDKKN